MCEWRYHNISDFLLVSDRRERDRASKPRANRSVVHIGARPERRRLEISSGKSLSPLAHRSFGHSLVGSRSFCAGRIKFTPDAASARQTFRIRPFPTTCIMHATVGCCRTTRSLARSRIPFALISLFLFLSPSLVSRSESWFAGHHRLLVSRGITRYLCLSSLDSLGLFPRPIGQSRL